MTLREWLILIGILVISGVVIDGYRRMKLARKRATELNFGLEEVKGYDDQFSSELPNGGARRTGNGIESDDLIRERVEPGFSADGDIPLPDTARQHFAPVDGHPPMLEPDESFEPELAAHSGVSNVSEQPDLGEPVPVLMNLDDSEQKAEPEMPRETEEFALSSQEIPVNSHHENSDRRNQRSEKLSDRPPASEVIVINVLAKGSDRFDGARLMQSLRSSGMCYGDMAIFHRYANVDGSGKILFSLANGVEPGSFDFDGIESTETPAVSFFMGMPGPENPMKAFTIMEEAARQLALDLGGELKDEQFSVMTQQTLEHCRQRIREYERKQLAHKVSS